MTPDLTEEMIQVMFRAVIKRLDEMPANEATIDLLHQYRQTLQWLQARAQEIDNCSETKEMFSTSINSVSQMIDQATGQTNGNLATLTHHQVEPFNLVRLFAAWDRDFPGGSVAVLERLRGLMSKQEHKTNISQVAKEPTR